MAFLTPVLGPVELSPFACVLGRCRLNAMNTKTLIVLSVLFAGASLAAAQTKVFKIGGASAAQQLAQVESVTDFETFTGRTDKVTGNVNFDPKASTGSGTIVIDAASIDTGIELRNEHMRSEAWLDTEKYPTITFKTLNVKKTGTDTYRVYGDLTMHGVTKKVTTTVTLKYMKESDATRNAGFKGDVAQLRTKFNVTLADYGIKIPARAQGKVAPTVTISVSVYGQTG